MKFHGNTKITQNRANFAVRLEIPQPTENCGLYLWVLFKGT